MSKDFEEWEKNSGPKWAARRATSVRWRWYGQWPRLAMIAGWKAHEAWERLKRARYAHALRKGKG